MEEITLDGCEVECVCSTKITVAFSTCGYTNCPNCGMLLKVGACDA